MLSQVVRSAALRHSFWPRWRERANSDCRRDRPEYWHEGDSKESESGDQTIDGVCRLWSAFIANTPTAEISLDAVIESRGSSF
jgi:hypothetical protein